MTYPRSPEASLLQGLEGFQHQGGVEGAGEETQKCCLENKSLVSLATVVMVEDTMMMRLLLGGTDLYLLARIAKGTRSDIMV